MHMAGAHAGALCALFMPLTLCRPWPQCFLAIAPGKDHKRLPYNGHQTSDAMACAHAGALCALSMPSRLCRP